MECKYADEILSPDAGGFSDEEIIDMLGYLPPPLLPTLDRLT